MAVKSRRISVTGISSEESNRLQLLFAPLFLFYLAFYSVSYRFRERDEHQTLKQTFESFESWRIPVLYRDFVLYSL